jgi:hypothetical protein
LLLSAVCPAAAPSQGGGDGLPGDRRSPVRGLPGRSPIAGPCSPGCPTWPSGCPRPDRRHIVAGPIVDKLVPVAGPRPHRRTGDCKVLDEVMVPVRGLSGRSPVAGTSLSFPRTVTASCPRYTELRSHHRRSMLEVVMPESVRGLPGRGLIAGYSRRR